MLAPENELVDQLTTPEQKAAVDAYKEEVSRRSDLERTELSKEKTGVFTGAYVINPVNGEQLPIWTADYVLNSYGTGAVMAVPSGDQRDFEFATKFNLPITPVVEGFNGEEAYTEDGAHVNSGFLDGLNIKEAKAKMVEWLEEHDCGGQEG